MRAHIFSRANSLFCCKSPVSNSGLLDYGNTRIPCDLSFQGKRERNVLSLADTDDQLVPAVRHHSTHSEEHDSRPEALGRQVALFQMNCQLHLHPMPPFDENPSLEETPCCAPTLSSRHLRQLPKHTRPIMILSSSYSRTRRDNRGLVGCRAPCTGRARTRPWGAYPEA